MNYIKHFDSRSVLKLNNEPRYAPLQYASLRGKLRGKQGLTIYDLRI